MTNYVLGAYQGHDGSIALVGDGKIVHLEKERLTRKRHDTGSVIDHVGDACRLMGIQREQITHCVGVSGMFGVTRGCWDDLMQVDHRTSNELGPQLPCFGIPHHTAHAAYAYYTSPYDDAWVAAMDGGGDAYGFPYLGPRCITTAYGWGNAEKLHVEWATCPLIGGAWNEASHQIFGAQFQEGKVMALYGVPEADFERTTGLPPATYYGVRRLEVETVRAFTRMPQGGRPLCMAGGCALNGIATYALMRLHGQPVWVPPSCDDGGLSIGAALYVLHHVLGEPRRYYDVETVAFAGWTEEELDGEPPVARIVDALVAGKVVALAHGRAESGPRALGHRSLLADPRTMASKDRLNVMKGREPWRPVAPVCLKADAAAYFNLLQPDCYNFMTTIADATERARALIPAAVHYDGSARVQCVDESTALGRIVAGFKAVTGVPVVLNTSLNGKGQAIANTAQHARDSAASMGADVVVIGGTVQCA